MNRPLAKLAAALGLLAILLPGAALALKYSPPSYDFVAGPGDVLSDVLHVKNDTPDTENIAVSALNFAGKPGDETSGIPDFFPADEVRDGHGLGPWLSFPKTSLVLKPGETTDVAFKISVPKEADPGSHFGAVELTTQSAGAKPGVAIISNNIALVLLKVTGATNEDLKITSFTASPEKTDSLPIHFEARLQNAGNVHERPYGQVTIKNLFGRVVTVIPMNRADNVSVLPGAARRIDADWKGRAVPANASTLARQWNNFALGPYTAELTLTYGADKSLLTASATIWIFPWLALLIIIGGVVILAIVLKMLFGWHHKRLIDRHKTSL